MYGNGQCHKEAVVAPPVQVSSALIIQYFIAVLGLELVIYIYGVCRMDKSYKR